MFYINTLMTVVDNSELFLVPDDNKLFNAFLKDQDLAVLRAVLKQYLINSLPANVAKTVTVKDFKNGMNGLCHLKKIMFNVDFGFQGFYTLSGLLKS